MKKNGQSWGKLLILTMFLVCMVIFGIQCTSNSSNTQNTVIDDLYDITTVSMPQDVYIGQLIDSKVEIHNHRVPQNCMIYWDAIFRQQETDAGTYYSYTATESLEADGYTYLNWTLPIQEDTGYYEVWIHTKFFTGDWRVHSEELNILAETRDNFDSRDLKGMYVSIWPRDVYISSVPVEHRYSYEPTPTAVENLPTATLYTTNPSTLATYSPTPTHQAVTSTSPVTPPASTSTSVPTTTSRAIPNIAGEWQWNLTVTLATGVCSGEEGVQSPRIVNIVQKGNEITMSGFLNSNPLTTLSGEIKFDNSSDIWMVKLSGSYSEDQGTTTTQYTLSLNNTFNEMTGEESWEWVGGGDSCPGGKSTVSAKKLR